MAGYSGTPLPRKLGIKLGSRVALLRAPAGFAAMLDPLPPDVTLRSDVRTPADVIMLFATDAATLPATLREALRALVASGGLWIAWPKRTAGIPGAPTEHAIRDIGLAAGLVDNKICAIDERWSALRFVIRVADRANWPVA